MLSEELPSGIVDLLVLRIAALAPAYGYELTKSLEAAGLTQISEPTVYTAVRRLERHGLLESKKVTGDNGRPRRYYFLTADGDAALQRSVRSWVELRTAVDRVMDGDV